MMPEVVRHEVWITRRDIRRLELSGGNEPIPLTHYRGLYWVERIPGLDIRGYQDADRLTTALTCDA